MHDIVGVAFEFNPGAAIRNHRGAEQRLTHLIDRAAVIYARRTHQLTDDDAFRAVDDERTGIGHHREVAHKYFRFGELARFGIFQTNFNAQRRGERRVTLFAFGDIIFRFTEFVIIKIKF